MKSDELLDLLGKIDPQYVMNIIHQDKISKKKHKRKNVAVLVCVVCVILLVGTFLVWKTDMLISHESSIIGKELISEDSMYSEQISITEIPLAASPLDRMIDNLNSLYSDSSYKLSDNIDCVYMPSQYNDNEDSFYSWNLQLCTREKRVVGNYEKRTLIEDENTYEAVKSEISGVILKPFTRINDYSYRAEIVLDNLKSNIADYDSLSDTGIPIHYHVTDKMEAFESPDELILFLPNTPKDVIPDCINQSWISELLDSDSEYIQRFFLYNTNERVMYLAIVNPPIPETKIPDINDIQPLLGEYKTSWEEADRDGQVISTMTADCTIYRDDVNGEYKLNFVIGDSIVFQEMDVLQRKTELSKDGDLQFVAFGREVHSGDLLFILLDFITGDELFSKPLCVTVAESNVSGIAVNTFFVLTKYDM